MASRQGPGPPSEECGEPTSDSEQQVARDKEEKQEAEGAAAPVDPEMVALALEPTSTMGQVGLQLAVIGDDINRRYDSEFQSMLEQLQPTAANAYELFTKIASSLFESGINWGCVVALLGFGYRLALHIYQRGLTGFLGQVTSFVADFMLHRCIAGWIVQREVSGHSSRGPRPGVIQATQWINPVPPGLSYSGRSEPERWDLSTVLALPKHGSQEQDWLV
ncbi:Hypothetical predicted protein [Marmota monax]|uniref:Bcl-2 Bcl-2 homology region 1-3 domain-containing protein n=1 Tax=Marmota monax TaxID=9995 RepID=A0A5E4CPV5_MARMO|nr:hypothetical protein GHT09_003526 [Marmota monax]VTJ83806.1 Hypothetical predicted protein [Marmota monax]